MRCGAVPSGKPCAVGASASRSSPGTKLQLYTGQRTSNCVKLGDAVCTGTSAISITSERKWSGYSWPEILRRDGEKYEFA